MTTGKPVKIYRPSRIAMAEYRNRLADMSVTMHTEELVQSRVIDHNGNEAIVLAPIPLERGKKASSKESEECLAYLERLNGGHPIWRASNGFEVIFEIGGHDGSKSRKHHVDGYCPTTMTIYEFQGEHFHATPLSDDLTIGARGREYDGDHTTCHLLALLGFRVVVITEREWKSVEKESRKRDSMTTPQRRRSGKQSPTSAPSTPAPSASASSAPSPSPSPSPSASAPSTPLASAPSASTSAPSSTLVPVSEIPGPAYTSVLSLLDAIKCNRPCLADVRNMSARRDASIVVSATLADTLAGENFFRFYGIATTSTLPLAHWPEDAGQYVSGNTVAQYSALCATTHGRTIGESVIILGGLLGEKTSLPFSFWPNERRMIRSQFIRTILLACNSFAGIVSTIGRETHWTMLPMTRSILEPRLIASVRNIANHHTEDLKLLFRRTEESCIRDEWTFSNALSLFNSVFERVFGMKLMRASPSGSDPIYVLTEHPLFSWFDIPRIGGQPSTVAGAYYPRFTI